jgi:uncharacterized protein (DUF1501 family)
VLKMSNAQAILTGNGDERRTLVAVFLRGGADGLSIVAPLGDDDYYKARPRLAIDRKDAVPLDGFFGLHPLLRPLESTWKEGELAIVHGAGTEDTTRSHFEAQDLMEHGGVVAGGWLGRFLRYRAHGGTGALTCIAVGKSLPESLLGAPSATVMQSLEDFALAAPAPNLTSELQRPLCARAGRARQRRARHFRSPPAPRDDAQITRRASRRRRLRHRLIRAGTATDRPLDQSGCRSRSSLN